MAHEGLVYRGADFDKAFVDKHFKKGELFTERAFLSTSMKRGRAFKGDVRFTIHSLDGRRISDLSEYSSEREVLFPSGSQFVIIDRIDKDGEVSITMEQVKTKSVSEATFTLTPEQQAIVEESRRIFEEDLRNRGKDVNPALLTENWKAKGKNIFGLPTK